MTEFIKKLRETVSRQTKVFVAWCGKTWAWLKAESIEKWNALKLYLEKKDIPQKTKNLRDNATRLGEKTREKTLEKTQKLREDATRLGAKAQEKSKETLSTLKEKSAEAEASAKKYMEEKNIPEKIERMRGRGEKGLDLLFKKGKQAWAWFLVKLYDLGELLKKFYNEKITKTIPSDEISSEATMKAQRLFSNNPSAENVESEDDKPVSEEPANVQEEPSAEEKTEESQIPQEEASCHERVAEEPTCRSEEVVPEPEPEPEPEKEEESPVAPIIENEEEKIEEPPVEEPLPEESVSKEPPSPNPPTPPKKKPKSEKKHWSWKKRILVGCLCCILAFPPLFALFCLCVDNNTMGLFGSSPSLDQLKNPIQMEASEIYSEDNDLIGKFFVENRSSVTYEEMSPELINTLIYTEDQRFYEHNGIDYHGMFSAIKDALRGHARGASTITQQLVKNLFKMRSEYTKGALCKVPGIKTLIIKIKECIGAVRVEKHYTKQEILTMYLNTVTFGNNTFGIKSAAKTYFNTTPDKLTYEQAACIIGILKANTYYNPIKNPQNNRTRRNLILHLLADGGKLTIPQCDSLCALDLGLNVYKEDILSGYAHYFREAVYNELQEWCEENNVNLYHDGLKIYTTINSRMQHYAEATVSKQMGELQKQFNKHWGKENPWRDQKQHEIKGFIDDMLKKTSAYKNSYKRNKGDEALVRQDMNEPHKMRIFDYHRGITDTVMSTRDSLAHILKFLHCGFISMDPHTGAVKAWVGDVDFYYWQYDKVTAKRQPGSTFKLFVYTEALRQGMCSCDTRVDSAVSWMTEEDGEMKLWTPSNASGVFSNEPMTLKSALARSVNSVAVQVAKQVTPEKIVATAHRMGIESPVRPIPSICLGTEDVSLIELATAYSVIADGGMLHKPILVSRIEDKNGKVIYKSKVRSDRALDYETAFLMRDMLQEGLRDPRGTSQGLYKYKIHGATDFGGKTGTSANYSDAWYMNITPNLVTGAWVGGEYRSIHFRNGDLGQGSRAALPIVGAYLERVLNDKKLAPLYRTRFGAPKSKISKEYHCKPIEQLESDTTDSAMKSFFKRLFGRDDEEMMSSDSTQVAPKSRKELRRERRERRREERRRRW